MNIDFLDEPELEFGTGRHIDIRYGLMNYGPLDIEDKLSPRNLKVGIIGSPETVEALSNWLEKCKSGIDGKQSRQRNLFPRFPGFRDDNQLKTSIVLDSQLCRTIPDHEFDKLRPLGGSPIGIQRAVAIFEDEIKSLLEKELPTVVLCALPISLLKWQGTAAGIAEADEREPAPKSLDFHHLLKARAMRANVPIQIVLPMTYDEKKRLPQKLRPIRVRTSQDEATRAWNLHVAMYYKSGGIPWRLPRSSSDFTVCYVGISFYESLDKERLLSSVAQVFNERGEGVIVRGGTARIGKEDRQPHLDIDASRSILISAISTYKKEHHTNPARVVIHKSSAYSDDEANGFLEAASSLQLNSLDLLSLSDCSLRLFRDGLYPTLRGTLLHLDQRTQVLYTRGSVDFFSTYPGLYAPQTLAIKINRAEQTAKKLAQEIFSLTKMNWNNTQFDGFEPITLRAARQVGKILKYVPETEDIKSRYSFYM